MNFLNKEDFNVVCDDNTLSVIHQQSDANLDKAEAYAIEEVSSYLRPRYDIDKALSETNRNAQLVMILCDIALYHLISWLPKRIGFEIREIRYKSAIAWLKDVAKGNASPNIPTKTNEQGEDIGTPVNFGSWGQSKYDY